MGASAPLPYTPTTRTSTMNPISCQHWHNIDWFPTHCTLLPYPNTRPGLTQP